MLISTDMKIKCKLRMRKYIYYLSELINKHTGDITINKMLINILIVNWCSCSFVFFKILLTNRYTQKEYDSTVIKRMK